MGLSEACCKFVSRLLYPKNSDSEGGKGRWPNELQKTADCAVLDYAAVYCRHDSNDQAASRRCESYHFGQDRNLRGTLSRVVLAGVRSFSGEKYARACIVKLPLSGRKYHREYPSEVRGLVSRVMDHSRSFGTRRHEGNEKYLWFVRSDFTCGNNGYRG